MKINSLNTNTLTILGSLTALAATSQAAVVQITLTGNQISTGFGNSLNADVTGDGNNDVFLSGSSNTTNNSGVDSFGLARVNVNSQEIRARGSINRSQSVFGSGSTASTFTFTAYAAFNLDASFATGGVGAGAASSPNASIFYLNPISFTDVRINGGAATLGWLEVNAFSNATTDQNIVFTRVIFDDASTSRPSFAGPNVPGAQTEWTNIPEPSSIALLALGAGGLLARRRRQAA